jgi:hypothetical protein
MKMRLFTQSFAGEVRKWLKSLRPASIRDFAAFEAAFITIWGENKSPLQLLTRYNNMKRASVQEFSTRFKIFYNSILVEVQPPAGAARLRYADSFDNNFSLLLRERRSTNLDVMMRDAIKVEVNMMASGKIKHRFNRGDKRPQGDA